MSAAFDKLPSLRTYKGAKTFHDTRTPIRGQASQPKPLGARTDWQRFRIRATTNPLQPNAEPSIECVLYKTPVITYHPDNTVSVTTGTDYTPSQSTAKFISEILGHCCYATCQANRIVLVTTNRTDTDGYATNVSHKYAIAAGQTLTFHLPDPANPHSRGLTPVDPTPQTTITIDRAGANNVRKRYADFYRYLKATINLRTVKTPGVSGAVMYPTIPITILEFKQSLPTKTPEHHLLSKDHWHFDLPATQRMLTKPALNSVKDPLCSWQRTLSAFLTPLRNDSQLPAEERPAAFYIAFLKLAFWADYLNGAIYKSDVGVKHINPEAIRATFDELLFKFHSNEVFVTRPVKAGQAPGTKYLRWVDWKE